MALSQKKAATNAAHMAKLDKIYIQPYKEQGAEIRTAAAAAGMSLQGWILQACAEKMQRDSERG